MKKILVKAISSLPNHLFPYAYNVFQSMKGRRTRVTYDRELNAFRIEDGALALYTFAKKRAFLYGPEINYRINRIAQKYRLNSIEFKNGDLIVDCGANIGEVGIWAQRSELQYFAIEPDSHPASLCRVNLPDSVVLEKCLWNKSGEIKFFKKTATADSSAIYFGTHENTEHLDAITLDDLIEEMGNPQIKLLKIEAEGGEPEVIEGLNKKAANIEYVSVDAGFERGQKKEDTICQVANLLFDRGFRLKESSRWPGVFLFERAKMSRNIQ